jgi:hypothetical protein
LDGVSRVGHVQSGPTAWFSRAEVRPTDAFNGSPPEGSVTSTDESRLQLVTKPEIVRFLRLVAECLVTNKTFGN